MRIKLNIKQYEFLQQNLSKERADLFKYFMNNDSLIFEIDGDTAVKVRDWVGERLQKDGFDSNYELNEKGIILEQLEDLLYE
jgi:hypothetical protein